MNKMVYKKIEQKHYEPPHRLKAINMFCCGGMNEFYLSDIGVDVVAAVEISKFRAMFHSKLYPKCRVVVGDITRQKVEDKLVEIANREKPEILLASPVCQEYCGANLYKDANSPRLYLFENVLTHLRRCPSYKYCVIENAKEFKKTKVKKLGEVCVSEHIKSELEKLGFKYVKIGIQDAADFGAPMMRNRTIIIASKEKDVDLPVALTQKHITYGEMSADLDSIDAGEYSEIEYYTPSKLPECQIEQLRQTPSGERVKNPKTAKGNLSKCRFAGSYHRLKNEDVMHSALTNNGEISGFFTIPPAVEATDENGKKYFKNCRTLTLLEMFRGFGLPDNMPLPEYSKANERFVRELLGEAWCPVHTRSVIYEFVKAEFDLDDKNKQEKRGDKNGE